MNAGILSHGAKGASLYKVFGPRKKASKNTKNCYEALLHQHKNGNPDDEDCTEVDNQNKCEELECFWSPGVAYGGTCLLEAPDEDEDGPAVVDCAKFDHDHCKKMKEQCSWTEGTTCSNKNHKMAVIVFFGSWPKFKGSSAELQLQIVSYIHYAISVDIIPVVTGAASAKCSSYYCGVGKCGDFIKRLSAKKWVS